MVLLMPPRMEAPAVVLLMPFCAGPKTMFGLPLLGLIQPARTPPTRISSGWLFVLPRNCPAATLLPPSCQKFVAFKPFNAAAFTFVTPAPLPTIEFAVTVPENVGLAGRLPLASVPLTLL